ncbi:ClpP/crotonase [Neoconidiobolus thromboides FSU 785]|nr:ClpP/crotonase [Neoconidiobolus thromboides FSU 785]
MSLILRSNLKRVYKSSIKQMLPNSNRSLLTNASNRLALISNNMSQKNNYSSNNTKEEGIKLSQVVEPKQPEVLHRKQGTGRTFILNRGAAFNALNLNMIRNMTPQLESWEQSDLCKVILLKSNHPKAFCSGGDIKALASSAKNKDSNGATFFKEEYQLNHKIGTLNTPFVAIMDGITMGGGVGISVHAPFRIATEKTVFAMPECSIGLFPDVGGTFFLPRLDGELGTYLGLTGHRLTGRDVFIAGIATHYVPSERIPILEERLNELDSSDLDVVNLAIEDFVAEYDDDVNFSLEPYINSINRCFKPSSIKEIIKELENEKEHVEWAKKTIQILKDSSPTSLIVTREQLREGKELGFAQAFNLEYHLGQKFLEDHDFAEGVESKLIRKDSGKPNWKPNDIMTIDEKDILKKYFTQVNFDALELNSYKGKVVSYDQYPHQRYGLPNVNQVLNFIMNNDLPTRPNVNDILNHFNLMYDNKVGMRQKLLSILYHYTTIDNDTNEVTLKK